MKILRKVLWIFCVAGILFKGPEMNVQAASETVELEMDSENSYAGMDKSYSKGYIPKVENDTAHLIVPVIYQGTLKDHKVKASVNLGNGTNLPFDSAVYEKEVVLSQEKINGSQETVPCYLVIFDLKLTTDRKNGDYPVILNIQAVDDDGNSIRKEFSLNVAITDEKPPASAPSAEEPETEETTT